TSAYLCCVCGGVRWWLREQEPQRTNLTIVETGEDRHRRLLAAVKHVDQLTRQRTAIDCDERKIASAGGAIRDGLGAHRAQPGQVVCAEPSHEPHTHAFGGRGIRKRALAQLRRGNHV